MSAGSTGSDKQAERLSTVRDSCPFCEPEGSERIIFEDRFIRILWDGFPVSPGHALVVPQRHVAEWFDASSEEQTALIQGLDVARAAILERYQPDGFNVGINVGEAAGQTIFHLHIHLIPRYTGDVPDPRGGVRHVIPAKGNYLTGWHIHAHRHLVLSRQKPLVRGGRDSMLPLLRDHIDRSERVEIAVAFVKESGVDLVESGLRELLARGGEVRFLTGDYLGGTEPEALERLLELTGNVELRAFESAGTSFHPKAYIFHQADGTGVAYVGSSNLTSIALTSGVEWNYELVATRDRAGFQDVADAFDALFNHDSAKTVGQEWIDAYRRRRPRVAIAPAEIAEEPAEPPPTPHGVQEEALRALEATREDGNAAGLIVLATGLGKTWLSAFDSNRPEFRRILFVAHREEILAQARRTFRRVRPDASLGLYTGRDRDLEADVVFASIQTIGRRSHLERFDPAAFDYVVVDEFHHAAAASYRRLIDHFRPKFLLGLTATPERTDGGDLLALCGENLVYRRDLWDGIRLGLLSPFHYFGVPDEVDYANIPWRSTRFDEEALTTSLATTARAANALDQYRRHAGNRTLGFCCSKRHADFMADFFREAGVRAAAVHSGDTSAPRATSLQQLEAGELDVLFAVDMFNEGLDVPAIDTVMMLRPTESRIIWLQQFGRGLRVAEGKPYVTVVDYIGNHRTFLEKPRALFNLPAGQVHVRNLILRFETQSLDLPPGCEVTYELEAVEILRSLIRNTTDRRDALRVYYQEFAETHGVRPRAVEAFHDGYAPNAARDAFGSWFGFVHEMGGLSVEEESVLREAGDWLTALERAPMARSYKMLVLEAMLARSAFPGELPIEELVDGFAAVADRSERLRRDVSVDLDDRGALQRLVVAMPVEKWVAGRGTGGVSYFGFDGDVFRTTPRLEVTETGALGDLTRELVEWRLADYLARGREGVVCKVSHTSGKPIMFLDRKRYPDLPIGWTRVVVDGEHFEANFVKIAVNVVRRPGSTANELLTILRRFFGERAGHPGTRHFVRLEREGAIYRLRPLDNSENEVPTT